MTEPTLPEEVRKEIEALDICPIPGEIERIAILALRHGEEAGFRRGWIPVSERLPNDFEDVLVFNPNMLVSGPIGIGRVLRRGDGISWSFNGTTGHESHFPKLKFTHWMPLPEHPIVETVKGESKSSSNDELNRLSGPGIIKP